MACDKNAMGCCCYCFIVDGYIRFDDGTAHDNLAKAKLLLLLLLLLLLSLLLPMPQFHLQHDVLRSLFLLLLPPLVIENIQNLQVTL